MGLNLAETDEIATLAEILTELKTDAFELADDLSSGILSMRFVGILLVMVFALVTCLVLTVPPPWRVGWSVIWALYILVIPLIAISVYKFFKSYYQMRAKYRRLSELKARLRQ